MDPASKRDLIKAFDNKDELIKILSRNMIGVSVGSIEDVEEVFFPRPRKETDVASTVFKCRSCRSDKIIFEQVQTRAMDEGATFIFTCKDCKLIWHE